jgi:signal transduction histidine kinase
VAPALSGGTDSDQPLLIRRFSGAEGILPPPLPVIVGGVVSLIFASLLAWYFSRPILSLRSAMHAMASGKLDVSVSPDVSKRGDDLGDLGRDFDFMAKKLQSLQESRRYYLHNISHELRSPLARMQVTTDLVQQQPERTADLVARLERDMARMDMLVGELLMLERLDFGMAGDMGKTVDLQELLNHIADDARFEAQPKQCSVTLLDLERPVYVKGNQELLFRAFENVVRNAIRYSPQGGNVSIAARRDGSESWNITVSDQGRGVLPEEQERIFEPFFRSAMGGDSHVGHGLGLAITRRVVQEHGGKVTAVNRPEGGLAVTITLPMVNVHGQV